jgi:hypothetical protein
MLQILEPEERRPTTATGEAARRILIVERHDHTIEQHKREPSSAEPQCLWCQRAFTPRATGGSGRAGLRAPTPIHDGYSPR